ncbi:MAG: dihydrolipoyl dehydrogenase [Clostridia bacterium]|nr:dihydrolipoyl dehydrogenase [Clostridia bacterium]
MIREVSIAKVDTVLIDWAVKPGDHVEVKDLLCTAKLGTMTREVNSKISGTVKELLAKPGDAVAGTAVVCTIEEDEVEECAASSIEPGAIVEIKAEKLGADKAKVKEVCVKFGETIKAGAVLAVAAAGKLNKEITSPYGGEVKEINAVKDEDIANDQVIAVIVADGTEVTANSKAKVSVAVIGGGPGGYVAAIRAAQLGGEVTLIEKNREGGTCLNVGCIPTKALMHSAETYLTAKNGANAGVVVEGVSLNWPQVQNYRQGVSDKLVDGVKGLLAANGVTTIKGTAAFADAKTVKVVKEDGTTAEVKADKFIIATGSYPFMPPIPGLEGNKACIDSTGALTLEKLPESMIIIGGGVIGVELACAYNAFGTKVTVIEMLDRLMPVMDLELTVEAQKIMEAKGIEFCLSTKVESFEETAAGSKVYTTLADGTPKTFEAEKVLVAVGRRSNTANLNLEAAGVAADRGRITVNEKMQTNVNGIYAIGDCTGKIMLAHTAFAMGEVAAENAMGENSAYSERVIPSCVYMFPEFASVGLTEEQVKAKGYAYKVGKIPMISNGKSLIMEETEGYVKILSDARSGKVLGAHILGARATDLIGEVAAVMQMYGTVKDIIAAVHSHPTVSEAVHEAALACEDRAIHFK